MPFSEKGALSPLPSDLARAGNESPLYTHQNDSVKEAWAALALCPGPWGWSPLAGPASGAVTLFLSPHSFLRIPLHNGHFPLRHSRCKHYTEWRATNSPTQLQNTTSGKGV